MSFICEEKLQNWWGKSKKNQINGAMFRVHGYEDSTLSRYQFSVWSISSPQSQSKFKQVILWTSANWFWSLYWEAKDAEESTQYWRRKAKSEDRHYQLQNAIYSYSNQDGIIVVKNKQIDKWNKKELTSRPHKYNQLLTDKGAKAIWWTKDSFLSKWCWNNWIVT